MTRFFLGFIFFVHFAAHGGLLDDLRIYSGLNLDPKLFVRGHDCLSTAKMDADPILKEACDRLFYKLSITHAHIQKRTDVEPEFYDTFEKPPTRCYQPNGYWGCTYFGIQEALKYELQTVVRGSCLESKDAAFVLDQVRSSFSTCKEKLASDFFSCVEKKVPLSDSENSKRIKSSLREIKLLSKELEIFEQACLKKSSEYGLRDGNKSFALNECRSDDFIKFIDQIKDYSFLSTNADLLFKTQPGFEKNTIPDYYFTLNSCDTKTTKKKKTYSRFDLQLNAVCDDDGKNPHRDLKNISKDMTLISTKAEKTDEKKDKEPSIEAKAIEEALKDALQKPDLTLEQKKKIHDKLADETYLKKLEEFYKKHSLKKSPEDKKKEIKENLTLALEKENAALPKPKPAPKPLSTAEIAKEQKKKLEEIKKLLPTPKPEEQKKDVASLSDEKIREIENEVARKKVRSSGEIFNDIEKYLQGKKGTIDYAETILESEILLDKSIQDKDAHFRKSLKEWKMSEASYLEILKEPGDNDQKIIRMLKRMNRKYLYKYIRDNARLLDAVDKDGTNCVGQTLMIASVLEKAGIQPSGGKKIGVQLFSDHIQPVIFDPKTKQTVNLVNISKVDGFIADIYDNKMLLNQLAETLNHPVFPASKYLLVKGTPLDNKPDKEQDTDEETSLGKGKTVFQFPDSAARFTYAPVPAKAFISINSDKDFSDVKDGGAGLPNAAGYSDSTEDYDKVMEYQQRFNQFLDEFETLANTKKFKEYIRLLQSPLDVESTTLSVSDIKNIKMVLDLTLKPLAGSQIYLSDKKTIRIQSGFSVPDPIDKEFPAFHSLSKIIEASYANAPVRRTELGYYETLDVLSPAAQSKFEVLFENPDFLDNLQMISPLVHPQKIASVEMRSSELRMTKINHEQILDPKEIGVKTTYELKKEERKKLKENKPQSITLSRELIGLDNDSVNQNKEKPKSIGIDQENNFNTKDARDLETKKAEGADLSGLKIRPDLPPKHSISATNYISFLSNYFDPLLALKTTPVCPRPYYLTNEGECRLNMGWCDQNKYYVESRGCVPKNIPEFAPSKKANKAAILSLWTPSVSHALLKEGRALERYGAVSHGVFVLKHLADLANSRDEETKIISGPNSEKIPLDVAKLYMDYLKIFQSNEAKKTLTKTDHEILQSIHQKIQAQHGSVETYIKLLEKEIAPYEKD